MSRLDSAIRRLEAQRACLDHAAGLIADLSGPVVELGLGNGRTFDHLRERLPDREIFVFERQVAAHPGSLPDADHLILGDMLETLPVAKVRLPAPAALVHADVGSGDPAASEAFARRLGPLLVPLLAPGSVILADQDMGMSQWRPQPLPAGVAAGRYHMWRAGG